MIHRKGAKSAKGEIASGPQERRALAMTEKTDCVAALRLPARAAGSRNDKEDRLLRCPEEHWGARNDRQGADE